MSFSVCASVCACGCRLAEVDSLCLQSGFVVSHSLTIDGGVKMDSGIFFFSFLCRSAMQIKLALGGQLKHPTHFTQLFIQYRS